MCVCVCVWERERERERERESALTYETRGLPNILNNSWGNLLSRAVRHPCVKEKLEHKACWLFQYFCFILPSLPFCSPVCASNHGWTWCCCYGADRSVLIVLRVEIVKGAFLACRSASMDLTSACHFDLKSFLTMRSTSQLQQVAWHKSCPFSACINSLGLGRKIVRQDTNCDSEKLTKRETSILHKYSFP